MNAKPGDLAIAVNVMFPINSGLIVRVLHRHVDTKEWNFQGDLVWQCRCALPMHWYFKRKDKWVHAYEGPVPDKCLRAIRGDSPGLSPVASRPIDDVQELESTPA